MTCEQDSSVYEVVLEQLLREGSEGFKSVLETLLNEAMKLERSRHIQAKPYERHASRQDYSNGFKDKVLSTSVGKLSLKVPQVRQSDFYPSCLEKGSRTDRALLLALAEMYVQGTSTRKVGKIVEQLCGFSVNSSDVSRAMQKLDTELSQWRERKLGLIKYLYLDARYEKVRHGGTVVDCAVLIACGVDAQGKRQLLGVSVSLSEHECHWRRFLESLVARGMFGMELIISDAHAGLKAAKKAVFPSVKWQRCQFHLQQNAQAYVPKQAMKREVAAKIKAIFNAENRHEAERLTQMAIEHYATQAPRLSTWLDDNLREGLTIFDFPEPHQRKLRTTNMLERVNREIKRRTRVATLFPNEAACCRLVSAILIEISEEWQTGRTYMNFDNV